MVGIAKALFTVAVAGNPVLAPVFASLALFVCKCYRRIQQRRTFEWFYKNSWLIAIPLFTLFWLGVIRRLSDYGCTTSRYYLVIAGAIMTVLSLRHTQKQSSRFLYFACMALSAVFLMSIACPGIRCNDVSLRSQHNKVFRRATEMGILDEDGKFAPGIYECKDSLDAVAHRKIYCGLIAMQGFDKSSTARYFGIGDAKEYLDHLTDTNRSFALSFPDYTQLCNNHKHLRFDKESALSIDGYKYVVLSRDMTEKEFVSFGIDVRNPDLIESQARNCGWDGESDLTYEWLEQHKNEILTFKSDNATIVALDPFIKKNAEGKWVINVANVSAAVFSNDKSTLGRSEGR